MRKVIHLPCGTELVYRRQVTEDLVAGVDERLDIEWGEAIDVDEEESGLYCPECMNWIGNEVRELLDSGIVRLEGDLPQEKVWPQEGF